MMGIFPNTKDCPSAKELMNELKIEDYEPH